MMNKDYGHWDITEVGEFNVRDYIGFVYIVEFEDGKKYIGSKKFWKRIDDIQKLKINTTEQKWRDYKTSQTMTKNKILLNENKVLLKIVSLHKTYDETLKAEKQLQIDCDIMNNTDFLNMGYAAGGNTEYISDAIKKLWKDDTYRFRMNRKKAETQVKKNPNLYSKYYAYVITEQEFNQREEEKLLRKQEQYRKAALSNSIKQKGRKLTKEHKEKLSKAAQNRGEMSQEQKDNISKSLTGKIRTNEHVKNNINARTVKRSFKNIIINNVTYQSINKASIGSGIKPNKIKEMILNDIIRADIKINKVPDYVMINNVRYDSYADAARKLNVDFHDIIKKCNSSEYSEYVVKFKD